MITTVGELRKLLRSMPSSATIEVSDIGLTVINRAHINKRNVKAATVYALLDSGMKQSDVARHLQVSRQVVNWLVGERERSNKFIEDYL